MISVSVIKLDKSNVGKVEVAEEVLNSPLRKDILKDVVRWQLACRRQGTHSTKTKGEVRGGGKKPFKQKGTGNARQGSSRSPLMPGGGILFGPKPRDYSYVIPKNVRNLGLCTALSFLRSEGRFWVVDNFNVDGKTKSLSKTLENLGVKHAVVVDTKDNKNLVLATRNLPKHKFLDVGGLNVFDLLKYNGCLISQKALKTLVERLGN